MYMVTFPESPGSYFLGMVSLDSVVSSTGAHVLSLQGLFSCTSRISFPGYHFLSLRDLISWDSWVWSPKIPGPHFLNL